MTGYFPLYFEALLLALGFSCQCSKVRGTTRSSAPFTHFPFSLPARSRAAGHRLSPRIGIKHAISDAIIV